MGGRVISRGGVGWRVVCGVETVGVETVGVGWSVFEIRDEVGGRVISRGLRGVESGVWGGDGRGRVECF